MIYAISDTHIPERALELPRKFAENIKKEDIIFHAGDFTSIKTYRELENLTFLYAVCGNMDCPEIKELLPSKKIIELTGFKVGLIHGSGSPFNLTEKVYKEFNEKLDLIIFGHSHTPYNQKKGETLLFNPGSCAGNLLSWQKSYGIIHMEEGRIWGEIVNFK
jgi:putative phosphoesterase